jgi:hypothetical protein
LENKPFVDKFLAGVPGVMIGIALGLGWYLGFSYLTAIAAYAQMWGTRGGLELVLLFPPPLSIVVLALVFSGFRKHNVVTGILLVAIAFGLYLTIPVARQTFHRIHALHADQVH